MKALRFALPLFALALWSWVFYRAGLERGQKAGFERGQKAFIISRYPEVGLECGCRADPVPNPNPVIIFDGHTYDKDICKSPIK